jgi:GT2 family glycosyltransferase
MSEHADTPDPSAPRPPATAVICTRDRPALLGECLRSVAASMRSGDEMIVVESGDSRAADVLSSLSPVVKWQHLTSPDRRKSAKLNLAIRHATGDVLVLTDDDCRVAPGWVDAMTAPFSDQRVGVSFGPVNGLDAAPGGTAAPRLPPGPAPIANWNYAHGASMAVRRAAVVDVGGFDERLGPGARTHGEEADMILRMADSDWTCVIADAPAVAHLGWRNPAESRANLVVYERGAGAWLGAGLRRRPRRVAKLFALRLLYQIGLWKDRQTRGIWYGPRMTVAFFGGLLRGLSYPPRRWL